MRMNSSTWVKSTALCLGLFATVPHISAENTIHFDESTNLKAVYDAGLRPWRVRTDERSTLLLTDQQVRIVSPGGGAFSMPVQIGNLGVLADNELGKADFISPPMPLHEAITLTREICGALGIKIGQVDGMVSLEEKANELATMGNKTPDPQFWGGNHFIGRIHYSVHFTPLFGLKETRGKVSVMFQFVDPGKPMKFLDEPIKPPPGYENVSMEAPPRDPNQKPFPNPEYTFEKMIERIESAKQAEGRK
jgi:hypothetical protein